MLSKQFPLLNQQLQKDAALAGLFSCHKMSFQRNDENSLLTPV